MSEKREPKENQIFRSLYIYLTSNIALFMSVSHFNNRSNIN